jgi:hypothetical protein
VTTLHTSVTQILVFSVTLLGSGFERRKDEYENRNSTNNYIISKVEYLITKEGKTLHIYNFLKPMLYLCLHMEPKFGLYRSGRCKIVEAIKRRTK